MLEAYEDIQMAFLIFIKFILSELGPFELSHFEKFDQIVEFLVPNILTVSGEKVQFSYVKV